MGITWSRFGKTVPSGLYSIRLKDAHSQMAHVLSSLSPEGEFKLCLVGQDDGSGHQKWVIKRLGNGNYKIYTYTGMIETCSGVQMGFLLASNSLGEPWPQLVRDETDSDTEWEIDKKDGYFKIILVTSANLDNKYLLSHPDGHLDLASRVQKDDRKHWNIYAI